MRKRILSLGLSLIFAVTMLLPVASVSAVEDYSDYVAPAVEKVAFQNAKDWITYMMPGVSNQKIAYAENGSVVSYSPGSGTALYKNNYGAGISVGGSMSAIGSSTTLDPVAGERYVLGGLKLKNTSADQTIKPVFGVQLASRNSSNAITDIESCFVDVTVKGDNWQDFAHTFEIGTTSAADKALFFAGLSATDSFIDGASIDVDVTNAYFAKEVIDITNELSANVVENGDTISGTAKIVNQLGATTDIEQTFSEIVVVDYTRTTPVSGFTVSNVVNGEYTVTVGENVAPGYYYVVARSNTAIPGTTINKGDIINVGGEGIDLYVAPNGNDNALGMENAPLASLDGARARVRELKGKGIDVSEVIFKEGDYITRNVTFTEEDSGTAETPTVYRAETGAKVRFKGSVVLDTTKATEVTNAAALSRIKSEVKSKIVQIDLLEQGLTQADITDTSLTASLQGLNNGDYNSVFVDGVEGTLAQWPNGNNFTTWDESVEKTWTVTNSDGTTTEKSGIIAFTYTDEEPDRWVNATNWWIGAFPDYDFNYQTSTITEVDAANNTLVATEQIPLQFTSEKSKRWKAFNLLEELDVPGEFYIDRDAMMLYMYPTGSLDDAVVELAVENKALVTINKVSHVTFSGIEFCQSALNGVDMTDVLNVDFIDCTFRGIARKGLSAVGSTPSLSGKYTTSDGKTAQHTHFAVFLSKDGVNDMNVKGCVFDNIGYMGLITHGGDVDTLKASNNIIEDCYFYGIGNRYCSAAVVLAGCGNTFRNNVVTRASKHAITIYGNNHTIEENEIHDVLRTIGDGGAIYQGASQVGRGTTIQKNYLHDIQVTDERVTSSTCAIYMDDGQQGNTVTQNIIVNARVGYNSNWAGAMEFTNNTIVDCNRPWAFYGSIPQVINNHYIGSSIFRNIGELMDTLYDEELYLNEYSKLKTWVESSRVNPLSQSVHSKNLAVGSKLGNVSTQEEYYATWSTTEGEDYDNVHVTATQEFVDDKNHDYRLRSDYYLSKRIPTLLSDTNFNIDDLGLQTKTVTLNATTSPYKLLYPVSATVSSDDLMLLWEEAFGANEYLVEISSSSNFTGNVWSDTVRFNSVEVPSGVLTNGRTYYWRVTAINNSRGQAATWRSSTATGSFTVSN